MNSFLKATERTYNNPSFIIRNKSKFTLDQRKFVIVRVTPNDYQSVMELFWNSYFIAEPTTVAAGLANTRNVTFENKIMESMAQGMSLMVRCRYDGSVVGAAINTAMCPWDPDLMDEFADTCSCQRMSDLLHFLAHISRAPKLWTRFCETKIFEVSYLATRPDDRRQGIGLALLQRSLDLGKDLSYKVLRVDGTSRYTQLICEKLKMKMVYEIPYESYRGPDGKVLFRPPPPHTSVKIYVSLPHSSENK
ncbi:Agmatine N-acetyltransferase [Carabus blaptoides fortunei]